MTYRKQYKELKRPPQPPTRYTTTPDDPVWVRVGQGWCAAIVIETNRTREARVKFLTGAKEWHLYSDMRWRLDETPPSD